MGNARAITTAAIVALAVMLSGCGLIDRVNGVDREAVSIDGVGTLPTPASAWPSAQYDARHSSGTTAIGPQTDRVKWVRHLDGNLTPGPVIGVDGSILAATNSGILHALDPATGDDRWTFDGDSVYGSDLSTSPSVLGDGTVLWPGPAGTLFALDRDGQLLWTEQFSGQVLSPAIGGLNRVYVADLNGQVDAFEIANGIHRRLWSIQTGGINYASPSIGPDGTIYAAAGNDLVAIADLGDTAVVRWRFGTSQLVEVSNGVSESGVVVLGTNDDHQFGVDSHGSKVWELKIDAYAYSSSAVRPDGLAYFADNRGVVRTVDSATGDVLRTVAPAAPGREHVWTSVVADADGNTYWASLKGNIYGYNAEGAQLFRLQVDQRIDGYPALDADGTLYVGTTEGVLYAIGK
ncbi:hypothetical protein BH11ACT3_BH11ACT3_21120 [soil metagenome]